MEKFVCDDWANRVETVGPVSGCTGEPHEPEPIEQSTFQDFCQRTPRLPQTAQFGKFDASVGDSKFPDRAEQLFSGKIAD